MKMDLTNSKNLKTLNNKNPKSKKKVLISLKIKEKNKSDKEIGKRNQFLKNKIVISLIFLSRVKRSREVFLRLEKHKANKKRKIKINQNNKINRANQSHLTLILLKIMESYLIQTSKNRSTYNQEDLVMMEIIKKNLKILLTQKEMELVYLPKKVNMKPIHSNQRIHSLKNKLPKSVERIVAFQTHSMRNQFQGSHKILSIKVW